jgi:signal transduction histidine kinase
METVWWRRALDQRLGALTGAAIILWTLATAIVASVATTDIANAMLSERRTRAQSIAARLDSTLEDAYRQLDSIAAASAAQSTSLGEEVRRLTLAESVARIARGGQVLWTRTVGDGLEAPPLLADLAARFTGPHVQATGYLDTTNGPRVLLIVPARESDPLGGVVAAALRIEATLVESIVRSYADEPYRVRLVDADGREVAASRPDRGDQPAVDTAARQFLIAEAAVSRGAWRLQLVQSRDEALAPVFRLRGILVGSSLVLIPFAVLVAAATGRSIRKPVLAMTTVAERLARGEFAEPVKAAGEDEIGRLAESLETLRQALQADDRRSRLLKHVIAAQEEERRRIARELHDETTQQLTVLAMQLGLATAADPHTNDLLARSRALVARMVDDMHRVIHDLRPSVLDDLGLLPAIRAYAEKRLASVGVQVSFEFPPTIPALSAEVTIALYRVVQEAVNNVARHAHAGAVLIACTLTNTHLVLEIEDDGVGFELRRVDHPRASGEGLGLLGMRERLTLLGGRLEIESESGRGTRVIAIVPFGVAAQEAAA